MGQIATSAVAMRNGVSAVTGAGKTYRLAVTGTWAADDHFTLTLLETLTGRTELVGHGSLTGATPNFLKTYKKKLHLTAGTALFFSALSEPTVFNQFEGIGNSFIEMADELGIADDLVAIAIFRRYLAIFGRRHVQLWAMDPDPALNQNVQTLENAGTVNGGSVQAVGTLDVLHCTDAGIRSLAARQQSEDALVDSPGEPIDALVQAAMAAAGTAGMCSVIEPRSNRYWLAIGGTIYVYSYFPRSGVAAFSTYTARCETGWTLTITGGDATGRITVSLFADNGTVFEAVTDFPWAESNEATAAALRTALAAAITEYGASSTVQGLTVDGATITVRGPAGLVDFLGNTTISTAGNFTYTTARVFAAFTPKHFAIFGNRVFVRDTANVIYQYGGADGNTYDAATCTWETPWLDGRSPATKKWASGVDAGMEGAWVLKAGNSPKAGSASLREVYRNNESSFDLGRVANTAKGSFFKLRGETTGATYARFGLVAQHFEKAEAS